MSNEKAPQGPSRRPSETHHLEWVTSQINHAHISIDEAEVELQLANQEIYELELKTQRARVDAARARQAMVDSHAHARRLLADFAFEINEIAEIERASLAAAEAAAAESINDGEAQQ
ncbi:hypothetical protein SEA_MOLLYMUR_79 [Gordonia phage Mollymur]|uniref:Uncharacterized protein n=1 Tax=Gordonia phage Mollymur TaxID=2590895 RepID=A0A4Y6EKU3_9CAUD|nr:hypothetical protein PQB84_gp047 [Gordonia phage Mollymur]QDF15439.1 hypothetical protein SEA_MOLLYMUR_79 [Gordonia phage Mollymur]